jgi:chromosome segregation protein
LAQAREDRVRAEGAVAQTEQASRDIAERISDRLEVSPDRLGAISGLDEGGDAIDLEATERRLEKLRRERDIMGPVNLRAEQEAAELTTQIETMTGERAELLEAIRKLRQGIGELDREGRERLLASFSEVDRHFRELFQRLFGGGRAHLTLTESDDPLEAGLEIMASPPGKRLQALSLLSGGEQALTALALLFAVFQTNPAPICVLDEVDAPLDDANVDRFCSLVEHMAEGGTRFLIITHHRMTMARMDRLFGVTMAERGVSQLVSVDLRQAEALRQTA